MDLDARIRTFKSKLGRTPIACTLKPSTPGFPNGGWEWSIDYAEGYTTAAHEPNLEAAYKTAVCHGAPGNGIAHDGWALDRDLDTYRWEAPPETPTGRVARELNALKDPLVAALSLLVRSISGPYDVPIEFGDRLSVYTLNAEDLKAARDLLRELDNARDRLVDAIREEAE